MSEGAPLNLLTEEELAALEQAAHAGDIDTVHDADVDMMDAGDSVVFKTPQKGKAKVVDVPVTVRRPTVGNVSSHPLDDDNPIDLRMPAVVARKVALAMVDGQEDQVTDELLQWVRTMNPDRVAEILKPTAKVATAPSDGISLAESVRKQSIASAVQKPPFFTGKTEWSNWLSQLMPWLSLQSVKTDAECISMALSLIKGDALSYWKSTDVGIRYYQLVSSTDMADAEGISWEEFSETMAAVPTDIFHTPLSVRSDLDKLRAGSNFRIFQAKVDSLLAKSKDMDENTKLYFYLKCLPETYRKTFSMDNVHNKEWLCYQDLKRAVCKKVQLEGWNVPAPTHSSKAGINAHTPVQNYTPQYTQQRNTFVARGRGGFGYNRGGGDSFGYGRGGGGRGYGRNGPPTADQTQAPQNDASGRGGGQFGNRGRGRFSPYSKPKTPFTAKVALSKSYRKHPAIVNAVLAGNLTVDNHPTNAVMSHAFAGQLKAPLPLIDVIGQPITAETKQADFESDSCFFCHKVGHVHGFNCTDWCEYMQIAGYFNNE